MADLNTNDGLLTVTFGSMLKEIRELKGLSTRQLAEISGVSQTYISHLETGRKENTPSPDILAKLADPLGVTYEQLMELAGYIKPGARRQPTEQMTNHDYHRELLDFMHEQYVDKNTDYGNSFSETFDRFGLTAPIVRMWDKLQRIETLSKQDARVKDESIRDTLLDLANYAIMTVIELDKRRGNE